MSNKTNLILGTSNSVNISVDSYDNMLKTIWELKLKIEKEQEPVNELQTTIYKQDEQIAMLLHKETARMLKTYGVKKEDICATKQTTGLAFLDTEIAYLLSKYDEDTKSKVWDLAKKHGSDLNQ